ncbi:MAG TPA: hypothetical protein VJ809_00210 [Pirellulales bacterium]|nr:hypothetical protein [Pirellulales bacterium]
MLCTLVAVLAVGTATNLSHAGETRGDGRFLVWRPLRPSQERTLRQERETDTTPNAAKLDEASAARANRRTHVDPHVKRVVLQQQADPLNNPFGDSMPASPFGAGAPQTAPAPIDEGSPTPAADAPSTDLPSTSATGQPGPNPFEDDKTTTQSQQAPGPLPDNLTQDPSTAGNGLGPLEPYDGDIAAADPKKDCQTALANLRANRLTVTRSRRILDLRPTEAGDLPYECTLGSQTLALDGGRTWPQTCYTWKASGLCHKPLYFEQSHMERYGHSWGPVLDPVISGAHFFASVPLLPYHMGLEPPCECVYPLGHYRPGSCAPHYIEPWPWSIRGGALQATAVTGLIFAVP